MQNMEPIVLEWGVKLIGAILILLLGKWLARIVQNVIYKVMHRGHMDETLVTSLGDVTYYVILMFAILAAIAHLGVQTTSIIAVVGAAGLAIGLALQGSLGSFASGILLLFLRPFKTGDYVEVGGVTGNVADVSIFTTTLNTPDNKRVIIPNARVTGGTIINYSSNERRRVDLVVRISYEDDIDRAREVLHEVMRKDDRVLGHPAPVVAVVELGDTAVHLGVRPWVKTRDYWPVYHDLTEKIKKQFDQEGFKVPFPLRHEG
jgi:small conductance mechanosensitive channel